MWRCLCIGVLLCTVRLAWSQTPIAHYTLDNTPNDSETADGAQNGTLVNSPSYVPGQIGQGLQFSGTNYVNLGQPTAFNNLHVFSASAWVNCNGTCNGNDTIVAHDDGTNRRWHLRLDSLPTELNLSIFQANVRISVEANVYPTAAGWHHVVGTYDGANLKIYLDGTLVGTAAATGNVDQDAGNAFIGAGNTTGTTLMVGLVDDVRLYGVALTQAQVTTLYNAGLQATVKAFPTAEGWGENAVGGRGGSVCKVTSLADSGANTLRDCLTRSGARTVIFDTSGTIDLVTTIVVSNPFLTIAGQTAPGGGIVVKGEDIDIQTNDVIIRHLRHRAGPDVDLPGSANALRIQNTATDVIVDHSSLSWGADDTLGVGGGSGSSDITVQWSIIAEGIHEAFVGTPSDFGKNMIVAGGNNRLSLLHNLHASSWDRGPNASIGDIQVMNSVWYNFAGGANVFPSLGAGVDIEFVANYFKSGPDSDAFRYINAVGKDHASVTDAAADATRIYLSGNIDPDHRANNSLAEDLVLRHSDNTTGSLPVSGTPLGFPAIASQTDAFQAYTAVLAKAGARVPSLDSVDTRLLSEVNAGTGDAFITHAFVRANYPSIAVVTRSAGYDSDGDGMPDTWETAQGLNPNSAADGPTVAGNGYTNLENFLNELAGDGAVEPPPDPDITSNLLAYWPLNNTTIDATGNGHTGSLQNGAGYTASGKLAQALLLNGTNQFVQVPDATMLDITGVYTLAAWVYPTTALSTWSAIVVKNYTYYLYAGSAGVCGAGAPLGGHVTSHHACHATPLTANTWVHLAVTNDGITVRLYRDGAQVATDTSGAPPAASAGTLTIGSSQTGEYFPGRLDDVRLYGRALSTIDMTALLAVTDPGPGPPGPVITLGP